MHAVVADLDQIVDFGALADDGLAETRAVDGGVGSDLDVIADFDDADLVDFDDGGRPPTRSRSHRHR